MTSPQIFCPLSTGPAASKVITAEVAGRNRVGEGTQKWCFWNRPHIYNRIVTV